MRVLVLGGIRSGKSAYAESLLATAATGGVPVRVVATGPTPDNGDADWQRRIARHHQRRPAQWTTLESADLAGALREDVPTLVDDLGSWLTAHLDTTNGWDSDEPGVDKLTDELCTAISEFESDLILVSSEVGLSLVAPTPVGRRYQDLLGEINHAVAAVVDRIVLVVAGTPLVIDTDRSAPDLPATATSPPDKPVAPLDNPVAATRSDDDAAPTKPDPTNFPVITPPDRQIAQAAAQRQTQLTKPVGALGRLEDVAVWAASCQGTNPPSVFQTPTVVIFAGDHGVAKSGVSAYPPEVTGQMVQNFLAGGAAVNVLARQHGATVRVVDMSVDADTPEHVRAHKIRRSSGDLRVEDALTAEQTRQALAAGRAIADAEIDSGADLLIAGEMGIGNTTPATVLIALLTGAEPVVAVGRGTGIDDHGWCRKTAAVRDGMRRARVHARVPHEMLQRVAGADLTAMAGFLAQAAARRTPVLLDGMVVTAAALVADDLAPGARAWWQAAHRSTEPAHRLALEHLDLVPLLDLSMRLGEGSGALTALPVVQSAVATLASMATFTEAGVSGADSSD